MESEIERMLALYNEKNFEEAKLIAEECLLQEDINDYYPLMVSAQIDRKNQDWSGSLEKYLRLEKKYPDDLDVLNEIGCIHIESGNFLDARDHFARCLLDYPDNHSFLSNQGVAFKKLGDLVSSKACFSKLLAIQPQNSVCHSNLASCLNALKDFEPALKHSKVAAELDPGSSAAFNNMGVSYKGLGYGEHAEKAFKKAIELSGLDQNCHINYGNYLFEQSRIKEAAEQFLEAISIKKNSEALNGLALCREAEGFYYEALELLNNALKLDNSNTIAIVNLANLLSLIGAPKQADRLYESVLQKEKDNLQVRSKKLFNLNYIYGLDRQTVLEESKKYNDILLSSGSKLERPTLPLQDINIGFVSGDMQSHPIGFFLASLLPLLLEKSVRVHIFYNDVIEDFVTKNIQKNCTSFEFIRHRSDQAVVDLIIKKNISILIDLSGHTGKNRLPIFGLRPCPIQCSWLGYFATTGLAKMDYFLSDPVLSAGDVQDCFTEKLFNLASIWLCRGTISIQTEFGPAPSLTNGYITFGSFVNRAKINNRVIALWANILNSIPESRIFFKAKQYSDELVRNQLLSEFRAWGVSKERIDFEGPSTLGEYYCSYNKVDIMLDTFPFPGGTTSFDALYMGVPLITLSGDTYLSRFGNSLLSNSGLKNWIATCEEDYKALAIKYSADIEGLSRTRKNIRDSIGDSPLFDMKSFSEEFYNSVIEMIAVEYEDK